MLFLHIVKFFFHFFLQFIENEFNEIHHRQTQFEIDRKKKSKTFIRV